MFLRNWYKLLSCVMLGNPVKCKTTAGADTTFYFNGNNMGGLPLHSTSLSTNYGCLLNTFCTSYANAANNGGVVFGTGNAAPTLDDYKLSGDIVSGVTVTSALKKSTVENDHVLSCTYTITNGSTSTKTISEVGFWGMMCNSTSGTSFSNRYAVLFERTVLDTPVVIEPQGVGVVVYTIRLNEPTA